MKREKKNLIFLIAGIVLVSLLGVVFYQSALPTVQSFYTDQTSLVMDIHSEDNLKFHADPERCKYGKVEYISSDPDVLSVIPDETDKLTCKLVSFDLEGTAQIQIRQVQKNGVTDSNLNHTGIYLYSKGKIMIHLTFDYKTDEKCTTPGQYLKYHRTFQGFTTRELAEKVGIVPATLVLYENDRHPIKHSTAVALANALGIDRNRLLDKYTAFVDYPYSSLLKKVRQELSLTQMQMAEVIGIGQTSYSGWEREIRVPRRKEYEKILAALKKLKVNVDTYLCHPAST